ncbi:MAG: substrate-binding domain-containing protein [Pseudomonadota bacterium]
MTRIFAVLFCLLSNIAAADTFITLASTTSTENSGLYDAILPHFTDATGIDVRVVAVGTGQAIKLAENGDADLLLVHHRPSEEAFVAAGFGVERFDVMYNDFVLIGPAGNPAGITQDMTVVDAFETISGTGSVFVSRGDDSGTHKKEREIWEMAGLEPEGQWYLDVGRGMGAALNIAAAQNAYVLSDRGTWLSFQNRAGLSLVYEGDPPLFNPYGIVLVNPTRHPHTKVEAAKTFIDWITSESGQSAIDAFRLAGEQLFFSNAITQPSILHNN